MGCWALADVRNAEQIPHPASVLKRALAFVPRCADHCAGLPHAWRGVAAVSNHVASSSPTRCVLGPGMGMLQMGAHALQQRSCLL